MVHQGHMMGHILSRKVKPVFSDEGETRSKVQARSIKILRTPSWNEFVRGNELLTAFISHFEL